MVLGWCPLFVATHAKNPSGHRGWIAERKKSFRKIDVQKKKKGELWRSRWRKFVSPYRQVGCKACNFLWQKADTYRSWDRARNFELFTSFVIAREVRYQLESHYTAHFTSRLHESQEKTFQVTRLIWERCRISANDTPALSSNKLPHPSLYLFY